MTWKIISNTTTNSVQMTRWRCVPPTVSAVNKCDTTNARRTLRYDARSPSESAATQSAACSANNARRGNVTRGIPICAVAHGRQERTEAEGDDAGAASEQRRGGRARRAHQRVGGGPNVVRLRCGAVKENPLEKTKPSDAA